MTSCLDAFINNIFTNIQNFDNDIEFSLEKRRLKKQWLAAANRRQADVAAAIAAVDAKYNSGFYIRREYSGIPQNVVDEAVRALKLGPTNSSDYFKSIVIHPNTKLRMRCPAYNNNVYCTEANDVERLCCYCAHNQFKDGIIRYESCNTSGSGCKQGLTDCDAKSDTNMFQKWIDSEKQQAINIIDLNIQTLKNQYELYTQRNKLVPNDIGCCQNNQFGGISANNIIFDRITNQCTIQK